MTVTRTPGGPRIRNDLYERAPFTAKTLAKVDKPDGEDGCWIWTGHVSNRGYGQLETTNGSVQAHRLFYFKLVGSTNLTLDHLCRNKACCNPAHLEPVTHAENVSRGTSGQYLRDRTHCPQGHPYSGDNLYINRSAGRSRRVCRTCARAATQRFRARKVVVA